MSPGFKSSETIIIPKNSIFKAKKNYRVFIFGFSCYNLGEYNFSDNEKDVSGFNPNKNRQKRMRRNSGLKRLCNTSLKRQCKYVTHLNGFNGHYCYSTTVEESKKLEDVQNKKDLPKSNQLPSMKNPGDMDKYRKMLYFRSKERGMLEADLLLGTFALRYLPTMNEKQLVEYENLLEQYDVDVVPWIMNKTEVPETLNTEVMKLLKQHVQQNPMKYRPGVQ